MNMLLDLGVFNSGCFAIWLIAYIYMGISLEIRSRSESTATPGAGGVEVRATKHHADEERVPRSLIKRNLRSKKLNGLGRAAE